MHTVQALKLLKLKKSYFYNKDNICWTRGLYPGQKCHRKLSYPKEVERNSIILFHFFNMIFVKNVKELTI